MRSVLALAVALLGIGLLLEGSSALLPRRKVESGLADAALEIVAAAKGPLLPAAFLGTGPERIGEAIRVGDRTLVPGEPRAGLRSALLGADWVLESRRCFAVASAPGDAQALRELVEDARAGAVLVLASSGCIRPAGAGAEDARAELARALGALGARARPFEHACESWALIALRAERGWVPLAEGYSQDSGVVLAFTLSAERESYRAHPGDLALVRAPERVEVFLEDELHNASRREGGIGLIREGLVGGQRLPGILQPPRSAPEAKAPAPSALSWSGVKLGPGSGFVAWVGLADGSWERSDGVTFQLLVDGELVKARVLGPEERNAPRWRPFQVDLRPFAGREVELELRVDPGPTSAGDVALWGRPVLVHGYDRPPQEVWAEAR